MKIYFASGKVQEFEIDVHEYNAMINKIKGGGIRLLRLPNGNFVPLNSNTIELIDTEGLNAPRTIPKPITEDQKIDMLKEEIAQTKEELATEMGVLDRENPAATQEHEPKILSGVEKEKAALDLIIAKSNCTHDGDKLQLMKLTGKKGVRYYHECTFCGYKSKFVKADSLPEYQKDCAIDR